jgi:dethiobiotin synthetase
MRGLFVTGTDTGVGKSVLSAALIAAMVAAGESVRAHKPVVTGIEEPPGTVDGVAWPADHELLGAVAGMPAELVSPIRFGPALSPHLAAELAGRDIDPVELREAARAAAHIGSGEEITVVEGVGGLLVPLADSYSVRDLAVELALPIVIAARPGLGTINHTLLTIEAARSAGLNVRAVVLTSWPAEPSEMERSNRDTIERLGDVQAVTLLHVPAPQRSMLARAGSSLPWRDWLAAAR